MEEMCGAASGRVSSAGPSIPVWFGVCHPPVLGRVHWKLSTPCSLGFLWRFCYVGMIGQIIGHWRWTPSPALRWGGGAESSHPLIFPFSCWQPAPNLKLSRGPQPPVISLTCRQTLSSLPEIPRVSEALIFRVKDQILEEKVLLALHHAGNYRVLGALC